MANTLSKNNITDGNAVEAWNVTQSVDAFTGIAPYDITISGSLNINEAPITNLTASIISASIGITGSLFGVASTSSYVLADNIFQPFTNITASGDINVTAITASEYIGLPSGLVSGSPQIPSLLPSGVVSGSAQTIANLPSGVVSGSAQIPSLLPSGVVSGSAQTVANLPSGVVSGSAQLPSGLYSSSLQVLGNISSSGAISASRIDFNDGTSQTTAGGGVTSIVAGTNITISPVGGTGAVTINSSGGGGGSSDSITDGTSTLDFDGSNNLQLDTTFLPSSDGQFDLGNASQKWRDLYLTDSTIYLGTDQISILDNMLAFNGGTTLANDIEGNATTATSATTATTALNVTASVSENNTGATPQSPSLLLFSGVVAGGASFSSTRFSTELTGKTLGTDCFITLTYFSPPAEPSSLTVALSSGTIEVTDLAAAGGFSFMGQIWYF